MKCVGLEGGYMVRVYYGLRQGRFCAPLKFAAHGGGGDEGLISLKGFSDGDKYRTGYLSNS